MRGAPQALRSAGAGAMKLTLAISLVAHLVLLGVLGARSTSTSSTVVAMSIFEHPAPGKVRGEVIVRLRLAVDEHGQVGYVAIVGPAGGGFDDIAVRAVREKCRFSAALDDRGRPVPFVIDEFRFRFPPAGVGIF